MRQTIVSAEPHDDRSEILKQLKEKFNKTTQKSKQIQILTVLPQS